MQIQFVALSPTAILPIRATEGSSALDLYFDSERPRMLAPRQRRLFGTGLAVAIPHGFEGQIRPRSGLARLHGITVLNSPGTIDSDYRGEIRVLLINLGETSWQAIPGERIAQLVIAPSHPMAPVFGDALEETDRGHGGFGSTGA